MAKKFDLDLFRKEALDAHNVHRRKHDVPELKISKDLNASAQKWAEYLAKNNSFKHSDNRDYGENIGMRYSSTGTEFSGQDVTDIWYKEIEKYDFDHPGFKPGTGHFTQVVWKGSTEFGIGKAITAENKVLVVGQYKPPGNMMGAYPNNVFPPKGGAPQQSGAAAKGDRRRDRRASTSSSSSSSSSDDERTKKHGKGKAKKYEDKDVKTKVSRSVQKKFQKEALEVHNEYRSHHKDGGVPVGDLELSSDLCKRATKWAKHLAKKDLFEHSNDQDIGENVAMHYSSLSTEYSGKEACDHWYSELSKYDFDKAGFQKGSGHFTQMVWKGSKQFGIGKAITKDGKVIIVGQYRPPGNVINHFEENVFERDDNYLPPPQQSGTTRVTRIVRTDDSGPTEVKTVSKEELDETIKRVGKVTLAEAEVNPKDLAEFRKEALNKHNEHRKNHQAEKLKESEELNNRAQKFAAYLAKNDLFQNSGHKDVGENIAMHYNSASTAFSGKDVTEMWYKQKDKYDFSKPGFTKGAGHFTQMIWKDSKEFGIGKAITKQGKVILVGFYKPAGNVMRKFEENVLPEKKKK